MGVTLSQGFLTSDGLLRSPFFKNSFELLALVKEDQLVPTLQSFDAKKVVLRGRLEPDQQLRLKHSIESKLSGTKKLHVFFRDTLLVAQCLEIQE